MSLIANTDINLLIYTKLTYPVNFKQGLSDSESLS